MGCPHWGPDMLPCTVARPHRHAPRVARQRTECYAVAVSRAPLASASRGDFLRVSLSTPAHGSGEPMGELSCSHVRALRYCPIKIPAAIFFGEELSHVQSTSKSTPSPTGSRPSATR
jgi:hypothetical protein